MAADGTRAASDAGSDWSSAITRNHAPKAILSVSAPTLCYLGDKSSIEWTEATWNPTTGCDRITQGCIHYYALTLAKRLKAMGFIHRVFAVACADA